MIMHLPSHSISVYNCMLSCGGVYIGMYIWCIYLINQKTWVISKKNNPRWSFSVWPNYTTSLPKPSKNTTKNIPMLVQKKHITGWLLGSEMKLNEVQGEDPPRLLLLLCKNLIEAPKHFCTHNLRWCTAQNVDVPKTGKKACLWSQSHESKVCFMACRCNTWS